MKHLLDFLYEKWKAVFLFMIMAVMGVVIVASKQFGFTVATTVTDKNIEISNLTYDKYDGTNLEGSDVINAIKRYQNEIPVTVYTGESVDTYQGSFTVAGNDRKSEKYIKPRMAYTGSLLKDSNKEVVGLVFAKEGIMLTETSYKELLANAVGGDAENSTMEELINKVTGTIAEKDSAIQALRAQVTALNYSISSLQTLNTSLTGQLNTANTKYNTLSSEVTSGKSAVASAITNKGVTTAANASFSTMASNVTNIPIGVKYKTGSITSASTGSSTISTSFAPSTVIIQLNSGVIITSTKNSIYDSYNRCYWTSIISEGGQASYTNMIGKTTSGFTVNWSASGWGLGASAGTWYAFE